MIALATLLTLINQQTPDYARGALSRAGRGGAGLAGPYKRLPRVQHVPLSKKKSPSNRREIECTQTNPYVAEIFLALLQRLRQIVVHGTISLMQARRCHTDV